MKGLKPILITTISIGLLAGSTVGVVAQDEAAEPAAPSFFTGTVGDDWTGNAEPASERRDDGVVEFTGESYTFGWDTNDPRISGTATIITNETDYREGATTLAPTGEVGTVRTGVLRIVNDNGSWEGQYTNLQFDKWEQDAGWLTGAGAYDGLTAYFVTETFDTIHGHITAEGPPPTPVLPAAE